jgi:hypothetical protein
LRFRKHTLLPLDDCLYALQATIPQLTRSLLHGCLDRHGISRLPELEGGKPSRKKFDSDPIGFFHIDLGRGEDLRGQTLPLRSHRPDLEISLGSNSWKADLRAAADFLDALIQAVPYRIHTVLTDNGIHFADLPKNLPSPRHRTPPLTKPSHLWTNEQKLPRSTR